MEETKFDRNFAKNPAVCERVVSELVPVMRQVRSDRQDLEETLWRFFNMWNVTKDDYHSYVGRSQLYIPEVRKNIEAQARQLTKSAFPGEDVFDVSPGLTGTRKGARAWRSYQKWAMDNAGLISKYFVAMRQMCMLGTSPIYLPWRKEVSHEFRSHKDKKTGKISPKRHEIDLFNGPDFIVRDLFRWYAFNPKKDDLNDGCFEYMPASLFDLQKMVRDGNLENYDEIIKTSSDAMNSEEFNRDVMRAISEGIQIQSNMGYAGEFSINKEDEDSPRASFLKTRVFKDLVFPEACEKGEDPQAPIPMMIDIYGNSKAGLIKRNPFYHQRPPYVVGKYIAPNPDEFYGQGIPWSIQYMQYEMNTKAEQGMDSATLSLNPIAIIDPGMAGGGNEFEMAPGAKWFADPKAVRLASLPDVTPIANQAIMQLKGLMSDYSDRSPALPPQLMGKSRTATQSNIVSESMNVDNWLFQMQNEIRILNPMLKQWESLADQNLEDDTIICILGRNALDLKRTLISKNDLLGRYAYRWKGATSSANKQIIARQMLDALKIILTLPPGTVKGFNAGALINILMKDLWELPDAGLILGEQEEDPGQDAFTENKMASLGLEIEVLDEDDDATHMPIHDQGILKAKSQAEKESLMRHIMEHKKSDDKKKATQAEAMKQAELQTQMMLAQGGGQGGGQRKPGSGNRSQLSPNASSGDQASGVRA